MDKVRSMMQFVEAPDSFLADDIATARTSGPGTVCSKHSRTNVEILIL